ncbi:patatin-like phospholipase family protein [Aquimarina brevivitae]|uniref:NTE family protein n=1 Tax=Aquimarina brevivitae TaxID=323412 RepID=A0A4Q7PKD6_9FLAO|nr:patatin-like phospholipase family protein [Aquimarina brevivitae]RZS99412.1 NTE family protein [Aquimarina brevivitae]
MRNTKQTFLLLSVLILLQAITGLVSAQEIQINNNVNDSLPNDVKVGLVLSGGGAKGLAHIGALKVIEEIGIRIDYIGGTSMGAIVGALYASGYNAKQLDSIFRAADFDAFIQDELPRQAKTFYEREDAEKYAVTLPFDDFKIDLPKSLSKGQNFYNQFSRYTQHVNRIRNFDSLPIPFFCMATNIENGSQVLLDKGYLPEAVSASGALPSVFSPVEVDGILMTDGGVANNYPIKEIKAKGAEIVIGIDVQDSLMDRKELNSVTNIMLQISNFRTINDMKTKAPATDVYIKPAIEKFSVISFDQADEIIANGEKAAFAKYEKLKRIKQMQQQSPQKFKIETTVSDSLDIDIMSITGNDAYTRSYILGKLKLQSPAKTTYTKLNEGINNLSATGNFDRISHRIINTDNGNALLLNVKESENKMLFRFALHYDDLLKTAALVNVTRKRLLVNNDVFSVDVALGDNIRYNIDYYIDKGYYWSIGLNSRYYKFGRSIDIDVLDQFGEPPTTTDINSFNVDYRDFTTSIYFETLLKQTFSFGVGAEYKRLQIFSNTFGEEEDTPRTVFDDSDYYSVFGYLKLDTYDNKYFPTKGFLFEGDVHGYLLSSDFTNSFNQFSIAKANFGYATPLSDRLSFNLGLEAGTKIGNTGVSSLDFLLGGFGAKMVNNFIPFYGYDFIGITGESFAKVLVHLDYELFNKNHLNASINYANAGSKLFSTGDWLSSPEFSGYALGYGVETFAGPIQIKYTYSPEVKESQWFFSVGFWF